MLINGGFLYVSILELSIRILSVINFKLYCLILTLHLIKFSYEKSCYFK